MGLRQVYCSAVDRQVRDHLGTGQGGEQLTGQQDLRATDAPSGTALALGEAVAGARGVKLEAHADFHRAARDGMRQPGSIGFSSVRAGDIVGDHTLLFAGADERLELTHRAHSRAAFARGALAAACWIARRPAGLYQMADLLIRDACRP